MLELACKHMLFVQEHKCLAGELKRSNPHWNGEKLYKKAQKIVGAMIQIITYRDYLPLLLRRDLQRWIPSYKGYKDWVDPRMSDVFTLAFHFAHASIPLFVGRLNKTSEPTYPGLQPSKTSFGVWHVVKGAGIDPFLWNLMASRAQLMTQTQMMVDRLCDHLSEQTDRIGLDLALNMQCGRDHGLPGYVSWRKFCGLLQPCDVKSLGGALKNDRVAKKFMWLYGTPRNSDVWVGALAEPFVDGGRIGPRPLMACLIGTQFSSTCDGDRFWWKNRGVFTSQQHSSLAQISLSQIICDNKVSRNIFRANRYPDSFVNCSRIPKLDLRACRSKWMEESTEQGVSLKEQTVPACEQVQISAIINSSDNPS